MAGPSTFSQIRTSLALTFALAKQSDHRSPCQSQHLDYISQFTSGIRHIQGSHNSAANTLSCFQLETNALQAPSIIDFQAMADTQWEDSEVQEWESWTSASLNLTAVPLTGSNTTPICAITTGTSRPFVPAPFRRSVFESLHGMSHPAYVQHRNSSLHVMFGRESTVMSGSGPGLACLPCQCSKIFTGILPHHCLSSRVLMLASTTFTLTLLAPCHCPNVAPISSLALTDLLGGRKPSPSLTSLQTQLHSIHLRLGFPLWYPFHSFY